MSISCDGCGIRKSDIKSLFFYEIIYSVYDFSDNNVTEIEGRITYLIDWQYSHGGAGEECRNVGFYVRCFYALEFYRYAQILAYGQDFLAHDAAEDCTVWGGVDYALLINEIDIGTAAFRYLALAVDEEALVGTSLGLLGGGVVAHGGMEYLEGRGGSLGLQELALDAVGVLRLCGKFGLDESALDGAVGRSRDAHVAIFDAVAGYEPVDKLRQLAHPLRYFTPRGFHAVSPSFGVVGKKEGFAGEDA